jgi:hypothetical protein
LCFQTAGLWEMAVQHRMGLPLQVGSVRVFATPGPDAGPLYAIVTPDPAAGTFDAFVVDQAGTRYVHMIGYRTATLREDLDPDVFAAAGVAMA